MNGREKGRAPLGIVNRVAPDAPPFTLVGDGLLHGAVARGGDHVPGAVEVGRLVRPLDKGQFVTGSRVASPCSKPVDDHRGDHPDGGAGIEQSAHLAIGNGASADDNGKATVKSQHDREHRPSLADGRRLDHRIQRRQPDRR